MLFFVVFVWIALSLLISLFWGALWIEGHYLRPPPIPSVRDIVVRMASRQIDDKLSIGPSNSPAGKVWNDLVQILSWHTAVPADEIRPEYRFWDDWAYPNEDKP